MGFFNFFRFFKSSPKQTFTVDKGEYVPILFEDDYCQVEIVPIENKDFIKEQIKQIEKKIEQTATEYGYTEAVERSGMPAPTLSHELRVDALVYNLTEFDLQPAKYIEYQTREIIVTSTAKTKAFGFSDCTIFFDTKDNEFVHNIWIRRDSKISTEHIPSLTSTLYLLGESYEFLLVDWNSLELIDLVDLRQIRRYLSH
jgi:hypothetical protein